MHIFSTNQSSIPALHAEFQNPQVHSSGSYTGISNSTSPKMEGTSLKLVLSKPWSSYIFDHFRIPIYHHPRLNTIFSPPDQCSLLKR